MKKLLYIIPVCIMVIVVSFSCGNSQENSESTDSSAKKLIAVIPKGTTNQHWITVHAGAVKAARELGIDINFNGPLREDDREEQVQVIETFISAKVDAIVLAPLDDRALMLPVRDATEQNIPVIIMDSAIQGDYHVSFVATDNYKGGVLAAERIGELTGGKGTLIVLRYMEGSASTTAREEGFLDTIHSKFPDIEILSDNQYAGATTETAYRASEALINRFSNVDAYFAPNESSTFGSLRTLQDAGLAGKIVFVGFDVSEKLIDSLQKNEIQGLVLQNPFMMGYLGVKTAFEHLNNEPVEERIDTGVIMATPDNMNNPEIQELLYPNLAEYLD